MPLTAPIEMPVPLPVNSKVFDLNFNQAISPIGAGFIQTLDRAEPMWVAQYSTPPLVDSRDIIFQAFLDKLNGSGNCFLGFDPRRPKPWAYRASTVEAWLANPATPAQVVAADYSDSTLVVTGLLAAAVITPGDYISYKRGNAWYCHRVITGGTAVGGAITLLVTPRPRSSVTSVAARMLRAPAAMKIMGRVEKNDKIDTFPQYTFSAVQFIDRT